MKVCPACGKPIRRGGGYRYLGHVFHRRIDCKKRASEMRGELMGREFFRRMARCRRKFR